MSKCNQGITPAIYCFRQLINVAFFVHYFFFNFVEYLQISDTYNTEMSKVYLTMLKEVTTTTSNNISEILIFRIIPF